MSNVPIFITTTDGSVAITGKATGNPPIPLPGPQKAGVSGSSDSGFGVVASSQSGVGIDAQSNTGTAVWAASSTGVGVHGESISSQGVSGHSNSGPGVWGESNQNEGVHGLSHSAHGGVVGVNDGTGATSGAGVWGVSSQSEGVHGETNSPTTAGIAGYSLNLTGTGAGVYGESKGKGPAGFFKGDVMVTGDIRLVNQDCAEDFDMVGAEPVEPGTVMVIEREGALQPSRNPYDKRVAGVVSGGGELKPGIILGRQQLQGNKLPVALMGKVYCKVDAQYSPIEVGDLLTTSPTPGHAMKADDHIKAFGAVIGKALKPAREGQKLIPILVALQ